MPESAKIAIFRLDKNVESTSKREEGFISEINKSGLEIIADSYIGIDPTQASLTAYNILLNNPSIRGVFTPNESTTLTVLNMRKRLATGKNILQIGFDSHPSFKKSIDSGDLLGVIIQKPFQMGYLGVKSVLSLLEGKTLSQNIDTPVTIITRKNLSDFDTLN